MKILQISDLHVEPLGTLAYARANTARRLIELGEWLRTERRTYDALIVTGDLSCDGNIDAYRLIRAVFESIDKPCFMIPGNHDRRRPFLEHLSEFCPWPFSDENLSFSVDLDGCRLFMMDTLQPGKHFGALPDAVLDWLEAGLADCSKPALVCTHHTPVKCGMGVMEEPFLGGDRLLEILSAHPGVRLCTGHLHRPTATLARGGVFVATAPSASLQMQLDLRPEGGDAFVFETPGYALHALLNDGWVTHFGQFPFPSDFSGPYPFVNSVNPKA